MTAPEPARSTGDWADERAEIILGVVMTVSANRAAAYLAAMLRVTREEGVGEALRRVEELPFFKSAQDAPGRAPGPEAMTAQADAARPQPAGNEPASGQIEGGKDA